MRVIKKIVGFYWYLKGFLNAFFFMNTWARDHKELIKSCKEVGMSNADILNCYARPAIKARFGFTDEQMDILYAKSQVKQRVK